MSRIADNYTLDAPEHLRSHDRDIDGLEEIVLDLRAIVSDLRSVVAAMTQENRTLRENVAEARAEAKGIKTLMSGLLVTLATAAVIGSADLLFRGH